jgi:quinol monooxygenase YgiN
MTAVGTVAIITATPEGADELAALLTTLVEQTHTEPGCILYSLERSVKDPEVFVTIEKWESMDAFKAHGTAPHMADFGAKARDLLAGRPTIVVTTPMNAGDPGKYTY